MAISARETPVPDSLDDPSALSPDEAAPPPPGEAAVDTAVATTENGAGSAAGDAADAQASPPPARFYRRRTIAMSIFTMVFVVQCVVWGLPTDTFLIFVWLALAAVCWNIEDPRRQLLRWFRDWGPILCLLLLYDFSRGFADNQREPHAAELVNADRFLFGGQLPTLWLQHHLYDPVHAHWWDVLASFTYMSHFVTSLIVAAVLWMRNRERWASFMRRWCFLTAIALATYFVYPAAPPWWASQFGYITDHVERLSSRGWSAIGLSGTGRLLAHGQAGANSVAAMPSLHSAFALLLAVFFFSAVKKRWWPVLLLYPVAMTFTLIYCGEHYMIDVLIGWSYVAVTFAVVGAWERWRPHRPYRSRPKSLEAEQSLTLT